MKLVGLVFLFSLALGASAAFAAKQWDDFATSGYCPGTMRRVANVANCGCRGNPAIRINPDMANCGQGGRGGGRGMRRFQFQQEIPSNY